MSSKPLIAALILLVLPGAALAQDKVFRAVDAVSGKSSGLARVANVGPDCKLLATPEIKVVTQPKGGTLSIRNFKSKPGSLTRCPTLEIPTQGVFYQPKPNFTGADEVVYESRKPGGKSELVTIKIDVTAQPKAGAKPEGADL